MIPTPMIPRPGSVNQLEELIPKTNALAKTVTPAKIVKNRFLVPPTIPANTNPIIEPMSTTISNGMCGSLRKSLN